MAGGVFGSGGRRPLPTITTKTKKTPSSKTTFSDLIKNIGPLTPERWIDIICCSLIGIFLIVTACTWRRFMDFIFYNLLFPIIYVGGKIVAIIIVVAVIIGFISFSIRRRRRYW